MKMIVGGVLALLFCVPVVATEGWNENGKRVPDSEWAKSDGDLGAQLVFTDKPDELFLAWETSSQGVAISEVSEAIQGKPIVGVILFTGCSADENGNCDVTVVFTTESPSGVPWGDPIESELWVGKPRPGAGQLQLGVGNMGLVVEPNDQLGTYKVKAVIIDRVANKRMVLERAFTAIAANAG